MQPYPATARARDRFVLDRRLPRPFNDPWRFHDVLVEDERAPDRRIVRVATVFLTGSECPWRCVMCDLWRSTTEEATPRGSIPAQIAAARRAIAGDAVRHLKLYNAGSFFDPRAVPEDDYEHVAAQCAGLDHVTVESHPALVGERIDRFLRLLRRGGEPGEATALELAMGLETAHPEALERLHKRMTLDMFARAAEWLGGRGVALRVFILIFPPFIPLGEQDQWLARSVDRAFACGASAVSLIPTRFGNGALEALAADGLFHHPRLADVERSHALGLGAAGGRGRVFVDLWDLERCSDCATCFAARRARLHAMNLDQHVLPAPVCPACQVSGTERQESA
jgi:radical SAM enzyme (TIGR01210 family)